jgi:hypothetical protein
MSIDAKYKPPEQRAAKSFHDFLISRATLKYKYNPGACPQQHNIKKNLTVTGHSSKIYENHHSPNLQLLN